MSKQQPLLPSAAPTTGPLDPGAGGEDEKNSLAMRTIGEAGTDHHSRSAEGEEGKEHGDGRGSSATKPNPSMLWKITGTFTTDLEAEMTAYETCNYTTSESVLQRAKYINQSREEVETESARTYMMRWVLCFFIAMATALVAVAISWSTKLFLKMKLHAAQDMATRENEGHAPKGAAYMVALSITLAYVAFGGLFVLWEPVAAGSGIPEIKSLLNGIMMKRSMRFKTLLAKATGVVFAVSAGLPVGKEGPMIHSGAIAGAGISQGKSSTFGFDTNWSKFLAFRNDKEKRDFIACGAAAGVAAAFGAPLAGVMFCLEEGASWWHPDLTWRTLFCAMSSSFVTATFLSGIRNEVHAWGRLSESGLLDFSVDPSENPWAYTAWEIPGFIILGGIGGAIGALFNYCNEHLTLWRRKHVNTRLKRYLEAIAVAFFVALLAFGIPSAAGSTFCLSDEAEHGCPSREKTKGDTMRLFCDEGQYDSLGSLWFNSPEKAIKFLFYEPSSNDISSDCNLPPSALIAFLVPYIVCACITYGIAMPSGMFVPMILSGAALGRLYGYICTQFWFQMGIASADHGTYALMGSVAMLGGVTRMLISVTLIIIETTGEVQFGLPVFLTALAARAVGQLFNEGLYDIHMELRHVPFLTWDPPYWYQTIQARQIMKADPITFNEVESAGRILEVLQSTKHNGFPIVLNTRGKRKESKASNAKHSYPSAIRQTSMNSTDSKGFSVRSQGRYTFRKLSGIILRKHLCQLLSDSFKHRVLVNLAESKRGDDNAKLRWDELESKYPRFPEAKSLNLSEDEKQCSVELFRYLDPIPHAVPEAASVWHCYQRFRQLGLRHLCVVDREGDVIGMITRQDLTVEHCRQCYDLSKKNPLFRTFKTLPAHQRGRARSDIGTDVYSLVQDDVMDHSKRK